MLLEKNETANNGTSSAVIDVPESKNVATNDVKTRDIPVEPITAMMSPSNSPNPAIGTPPKTSESALWDSSAYFNDFELNTNEENDDDDEEEDDAFQQRLDLIAHHSPRPEHSEL